MSSLEKKLKAGRKEWRRRYLRYRRPAFIGLSAALFIVLVMFIAYLTKGKFEERLKAGDTARRDYTIPEVMSIVDTLATEGERQKQRGLVEPVLEIDKAQTESCLRSLKAFFFDIERISQDYSSESTPPAWWMEGMEEENYPIVNWNDEVLGILMDEAARNTLKRESLSAMEDLLAEGITEERYASESLKSELMTLFRGVLGSEGEVAGPASFEDMAWLARRITLFYLRPNSFINQEQTNLLRMQAEAEIEPVMLDYKKDEVYIHRGDEITPADLDVHNQVLSRSHPVFAGALAQPGAFLLSLVVLLGVFIAYVHRLHPQFVAKARYLPLVFTVLALNLVIYHLIVLWMATSQPAGYSQVQAGVLLTLPALITTFCVLLFLNYEISLLANLVLIYVLSALYALEASFVLYYLLLMMTTATLLRRVRTGAEVLRKLPWIALTSLTFTLLVFVVFNESSQAVLSSLVFSIILTLLAAVLYVGGFRPLLQEAFRITTTEKLLELGNLNQPLLKRLQIEAIGTYHHSLVMGTIGEAAAERIGADGVLVRVGALYHDIGKIRRPVFFTENQQGKNPHDEIPASMSKLILEGHVRDGITMAREAGLPEEIVDFIPSHHGTSLMFSFFHKALKDAKAERERPEDVDYRYEFHRPMTKETAILHLADGCESAVRSLEEPSPEKVESLVTRIIRAKVQDGQLDDCPLTLYEIAAVREEFIRALAGAHHQRIKYPDPEELEKLKK